MSWRDEPVTHLFRTMWRHAEGHRKLVVTYISLSAIANVLDFFTPLVIAWLLDTIAQQGLSDPGELMLIMGLFISLQLGFWAFHGPSRVMENRAAFLTRANYKQYLMEGTLGLEMKWHTEHQSGDTIDRIEKASTALYDFSRGTFEIVQTVVRLVSSYIALVYFNLHSIYLVAFLSFSAVWVMLQYDKKLKRQYKRLNEYENRIAAKIYDTISNITTIVILKIEHLLKKEIWRHLLKPYKLYNRNIVINEWKWFWVSSIATLMIIGVLGTYLAQNWLLGTAITVGTLYALYGYVDRINGLFFRFAYRYGDIVRYKAAIDNAEPIEREFTQKIEVDQHPLKGWKELSIMDLNFSYHSDEQDMHLNDVNITIRKGERIALVGESGSGKTTFLKILRGLYDPQQITVTQDGKTLESLKAISDDITLIPQEPELFATTIRENISMGVRRPQKAIEQHAKLARFHHVAQRLPKKYRSEIREKGVNLSGGEKQRLALARGLLASRGKEIILLDEPTSSVDAHNELKIYHNIIREFPQATIISTIHRLHLLHRFDTVHVFNDGRLEASGDVDELLETSPSFKRLWERYWEEAKRENE